MTLILTHDGHLVTDDENPIELTDALAGALAILADPTEGQAIIYRGGLWTNGAAALYVDEAEGTDDAVILTATYEQIKAAIDAGRAVFIRSESSGTYTINALATYGGNSTSGYTVTAGSDTYTASTADGALTKRAAGGDT